MANQIRKFALSTTNCGGSPTAFVGNAATNYPTTNVNAPFNWVQMTASFTTATAGTISLFNAATAAGPEVITSPTDPLGTRGLNLAVTRMVIQNLSAGTGANTIGLTINNNDGAGDIVCVTAATHTNTSAGIVTVLTPVNATAVAIKPGATVKLVFATGTVVNVLVTIEATPLAQP